MKKAALLILLFHTTWAYAAPLDGKIEALIKKTARIGMDDLSVYAIEIPKGREIADINKDTPLNPASCTKLVTTAVALKTLGIDYTFPTRFYTDAGKNLWIKGYGDPSFVIERLEETVTKLVNHGLGRIEGDIFIDNSYFDDHDFPGRQKGSARSYNALTSAVALNHSAITVEVSPDTAGGKPAIVKVDVPGIVVQNSAKTGPPAWPEPLRRGEGPRRSKNLIRIKRINTDAGDTIRITGNIPLGSAPKTQYFNVTDPSWHFAQTLKALLLARGIEIKGQIKNGVVPSSAYLLLEEKSPPLSDIVKDMNKFSSNFMAEQILKAIGAIGFKAPGTSEKGIAVVEKYLGGLGLANFVFENGSGLSYKNRIGAYGLTRVMYDIYGSPSLRDAYINSLSIAGVDGTMKKADSEILYNRLRAKTGTLNGVSTLAGFVPGKDGMIIFAIMLNTYKLDMWKARRLEEAIVEILASE